MRKHVDDTPKLTKPTEPDEGQAWDDGYQAGVESEQKKHNDPQQWMDEAFDAYRLILKNLYDQRYRGALLALIESCEELNVVLAEMVIRYGDPHLTEPDNKTISKHTLKDVVRLYEQRLKLIREKFDLPKRLQ